MRLAEALTERGDLQKRIESLRGRIAANARYQEGEDPGEDAAALLDEALSAADELGVLIGRINAFFGFPAVRQIRILQKPVSQSPRHVPKPQPLRGEAARHLEALMTGIESESLRKAVERLGTAVLQKKKAR